MRGETWIAVAAPIAVVAAFFLFCAFGYSEEGVGHFDQVVVIESDRAVRRVYCWDGRIDGEVRELVETRRGPFKDEHHVAEPPDGNRLRAEPLGGNRFRTGVMFTSTGNRLRGYRYFNSPHLAVHVEFADGILEGRVVDIPPGRGTEPVVVRLP